MKTPLAGLLALGLAVSTQAPLLAQPLAEKLDSYIDSYVTTGDFSGCVSVTRAGETLFEQCYGEANRAFGVPNRPTTKFRIGSVSKQFTAAAILRLEEQGKLTTNDTLGAYFPGYGAAGRITIEQLLTHTSGLADIYSVPDFNQLSCAKLTIAELADRVLRQPLTAAPGTAYSYSNGGFAVLAALIERISGEPFGEYLDRVLFRPLGLDHTGHASATAVVPELAVGYDPLGYNEAKLTDFLDPELLKGGGSLYSTVADLHTWIESIKDRSLLTPASYDKLLRNYGSSYGYGISVYTSFDNKVFGHDGRVNGYIADYLHYREADLSIIVLGNLQTGVADFFRRDLAAILFDREYASRANQAPPATPEIADPDRLTGVYAFAPTFKVYVERIDGTLQARANEGGYSELVPLADGRFFSRTLYAYIRFVPDETGAAIAKMEWTNNDGNTFAGDKE